LPAKPSALPNHLGTNFQITGPSWLILPLLILRRVARDEIIPAKRSLAIISVDRWPAMKLVLTGGPSGGKTTLAQAIQREFASSVCVIPEAASIVYGGGWPRRKSVEGVQHQQRSIYFVQRELESLLAFENSDKLLICDRGSIDGIAYWPVTVGAPAPVSAGTSAGMQSGTSASTAGNVSAFSGTGFLDSVGTTLAREIARYDWVLHLDTAPVSSYDLTNALRNESFDEARRLNEKIKSAWSAHPQRFVVESHEGGHFIDKLQRALLIVERIIQGKSYAEILAEL
jgi:hypothetical protein